MLNERLNRAHAQIGDRTRRAHGGCGQSSREGTSRGIEGGTDNVATARPPVTSPVRAECALESIRSGATRPDHGAPESADTMGGEAGVW